MLIQPIKHRLVPKSRICRFQNPVAFVRKIDELRFYAHSLDRRKELQTLALRHAIIERVGNDQDRRFEVLHKLVRRPAFVHCWIRPGRSFEFPFRKPKLFRRAVHRREIVNAVMRYQHFIAEAWIVVVSFYPIDHVTTIAGAGRTDAVLLDVGKVRDHGDTVTDVGEYLATPISGNFRDELLTIPGRTARIWQECYVAVVSVNLRIPTVTPVVIPGALRTAMNQHDQRIFAPRIEVGRLYNPTSNLGAQPSGPRDLFRRFQIESGDEIFVCGGQGLDRRAIRIGTINLGWLRHAAARKYQRRTVFGQMNIPVRSASVGNDFLDWAAAYRNRINWHSATFFGC